MNIKKVVTISGRHFYAHKICPTKVYLDWRAIQDERLLYKTVRISGATYKRMEFGNEYEARVVAGLDHVKVTGSSIDERYRETVKLMCDGVKCIYHGILKDDRGKILLHGEPDILWRRDKECKSKFGAYLYEVVDIKSALNMKDCFKSQVTFYSELLSLAQGVMPLKSWIYNVRGSWLPIENKEYHDDMKATLESLRRIFSGKEKPRILLGCTKCKECIWKEYCKEIAQTNHCITLLRGIGPVIGASLIKGIQPEEIRKFMKKASPEEIEARIQQLQGVNFPTLGSVVEAKIDELMLINRIGKKTALKIQSRAKSLIEGKSEILRLPTKEEIDPKKDWFILDFEGNWGTFDPADTHVYMAGVLRIATNPGIIDRFFSKRIKKNEYDEKNFWYKILEGLNYFRNIPRKIFNRPLKKVFRSKIVEVIQFVAHSPKEEGEVWHNLVKLFARYKNYSLYHYWTYETTVINRLKRDYGTDIPEALDSINSAKADIGAILTSCICTPTYDDSLKTLSPYHVGFTWRTNRSALALFNDWKENNNQEALKLLLEYNRDDLYATILLVDFLSKLELPKEE